MIHSLFAMIFDSYPLWLTFKTIKNELLIRSIAISNIHAGNQIDGNDFLNLSSTTDVTKKMCSYPRQDKNSSNYSEFNRNCVRKIISILWLLLCTISRDWMERPILCDVNVTTIVICEWSWIVFSVSVFIRKLIRNKWLLFSFFFSCYF